MHPARDRYHWELRAALESDGWDIADDPFTLVWEDTWLYVDLRVSRTTAAKMRGIELKSIGTGSGVEEIRDALGQYLMYRAILRRLQLNVDLYLGLTVEAHESLFTSGVGALVCEEYGVQLVVFDPDREEIIQWSS